MICLFKKTPTLDFGVHMDPKINAKAKMVYNIRYPKRIPIEVLGRKFDIPYLIFWPTLQIWPEICTV